MHPALIPPAGAPPVHDTPAGHALTSQARPGALPQRRLPIGAELTASGVHFRVWAPDHYRVGVLFEGNTRRSSALELTAEPGGYFSGLARGAAAGERYSLTLDDEPRPYPDPASRSQPDGPHGPSEIIDPAAFAWSDAGWRGCELAGQVIYEVHVGTLTREGTWRAAAGVLAGLADLGITTVEVMPVHEFPGRFGWGYDGVDLFAPTRLYGAPDDMRAFVDRAHALGLGVLLDVVYNHLGPDGNYLKQFSEAYFTDAHPTDWGEALNFDGPGAGPVREFFVANAGYWVDEFHVDGLRIDATQAMHDRSPRHVLEEMAARVRRAGGARRTLVLAENEPQQARLVRGPDEGGQGLDALWNDDFHHSAAVALTGRREAYFDDYLGTPQELLSAVRWGFLFQGQRYRWQRQRRGTPALDLEAMRFVNCLENHDQVANSARGGRLSTLCSPAALRAMTALLLLGPGTPMLFQGQEYGSSTPFLYFADHQAPLASQVSQGRREFLAQFRSCATEACRAILPDPAELATFERCKLDPEERARSEPALALHRDLLAIRRGDPVISAQRADRMHGAVLGEAALLLRFVGRGQDDRLLIVNLGRELVLDPCPEPLLAPPDGARWGLAWSSERVAYGGGGAPEPEDDGVWRIPAHAALLLAPSPGGAS
jgi:maltooligosyltrehalose trehalohydrolase